MFSFNEVYYYIVLVADNRTYEIMHTNSIEIATAIKDTIANMIRGKFLQESIKDVRIEVR